MTTRKHNSCVLCVILGKMIIPTPDDKNSQYQRNQAYKMQQHEIDALIVSYLMGKIGEEDLATLKKWAGESESNVSYFDHMKELWVSAISEKEKDKYDSRQGYDRFKERVNNSSRKSRLHRSNYFYHFVTCCAVCAILFFIGKAIYSNSNHSSIIMSKRHWHRLHHLPSPMVHQYASMPGQGSHTIRNSAKRKGLCT